MQIDFYWQTSTQICIIDLILKIQTYRYNPIYIIQDKKQHMILKIWQICLMMSLLILGYGQTFTPSNYSVLPNYAKSLSSRYLFNFNAVTPFAMNFDVHVTFPTQYTIGSVSGCQFLLNGSPLASAVCAVNSTNNAIIFSQLNINASISSIQLQFNTSTARFSGSSTIVFYFYSTTTNSLISTLTNYVSLSIINAVMSCGISSNSVIVGDNITYTLTYTPLVVIQANSVMQIQIQPWGAYSQSNFITTNVTNICNNTCTLSLPSSNGNLSEILVYSSLFAADTSASGSVSLSRAKNPASTAPITISIILLARTSNTQSSYMNCTSTFSVSTPNAFKLVNFAAATPNTTISATNIVTLRLQLTNPISSVSYLRIQPNILSVTYQFSNYNQNTQPFLATTSDGSLLLGNLTNSTTSSTTLILVLNNFTLINPPYANKPVSLTFSTQNLVDSTYYLVDRGTVDITCTPSTISQYGISVTNTSINAVTRYTLWFKTINRLISTSYFYIVFPNTITISSITCSITGIASSCTLSNSSSILVDINTIISAGTNLTVVINSVKNPSTTTPTSSISVYTYYQDSSSSVDVLLNGPTVTATSVPLRSVVLASLSTLVGQISNYTLNVQITNELPAQSIMKVRIPLTSFSPSTVVLRSFSIGSTAISTCSLTNLSPLYVQLEAGCFSSSVPALTTIQILLGNITNPTSTKPSDSWQIQTLYNTYQMEYLTSGITVTMISPAQITQFTATPTSQIVNNETIYQISLTFLYPHYAGDRVIVILPTGEVLLGAGFQCLSSTSGVTVSCVQTSSNILQVTISNISTATIGSLGFTVSSITNNWYSSTSTLNIQTTTNDSTYYYVQSGVSTVNFLPSTLTASVLSNQQIILLGQSTVKVTIGSPFPLSRASNQSLAYLTVSIPTDLTLTNNSCSLSYSSAVCLMSGQNLNISGFGDFSSSLTITFRANTNYFTNTSNFVSQLYYTSSLIATNSAVKLSSYCTTPCKQCTSTPTQCLSCLPSPYTINNTLFSDNSTCVGICPSTYYVTSGACAKCNQSACYQCTGTVNNCTSCQLGKYLFESTCLASCPQQYYASNSTCIMCAAPCVTCINSTACLTCMTNYFLDIDSKCVLTCSNVSYIGLNGTCQKCTSNCLTCSLSLSNCTSCQATQYLLFSNQCVRACQSGYYNNINSTCLACVSPCATCSSLTICQTCVSNYYLYNNVTCTMSCPNGTLAVVNFCQTCDTSCATCSITISNCTSCPPGKLFYYNQCLNQCPPLNYPYNKTCVPCIIPCLTCASSPELCLTCVENYYLLNNSCLTTCPTAGYYVSQTTCLPCTENCLTCRSLATCQLCSSGYYLLTGSCVAKCPDSHPIIQNRQCTACATQCATCVGQSTNCTSCTVYYFKYSYTCVLECPLTYYSNIVTYQCQDGLSSRIVFFPILITGVVVIFIVVVSKCFTKQTAFVTSIAALLAPLEMIIWAYVFSLLFASIKQPGVAYTMPTVLLAISLASYIILNIVFFIVNRRKIEQDDYFLQWATNNVNYAVSKIISFGCLLTGCKFFRIIYSRLFNTLTLSAVYKNRSNVFTLATIFSVCSLVFSQVPAIAACWFLVYNKTLKDQIFYSSVEAVVVTVIAALFALIDIYKSEDFFDESQFCKMKKYVQKVKDFSSFNRLQEGFEVSHEEGSVDAERYVSTSGGKFFYTKQKPEDIKDDVYFQQDKSVATDAIQKNQKKKGKNINIFGPIMEQDAQYYENQKYSPQQIQTQNKIQQQNRKNKTYGSDQQQQQQLIVKRRQEMGITPQDAFDDNKSVLNQREIKKKWNNIMDKRKQLSSKIFNRHPPDLQQIDQPMQQQNDNQYENSTAKIIRHLQFEEQNNMQNNQDQIGNNQGTASQLGIKKRRKKKKGKVNKQLEEIYLQRLSQRKNKTAKDNMYISDKSLKYDF